MKLAILFVLLINYGFLSAAQEAAPAPPSQTRPDEFTTNSKEGIKSFLEKLLAAIDSGNRKQVSVLIKQTEIPHDRQWFLSMYPRDKAESWIGPYEKGMLQNEEEFQQLFNNLAKGDGHFMVRKVNDEPEPGRGLEWGMLHSANAPLDIYHAGWQTAAAPLQPVGYFYYIDGGFRWDSLIHITAQGYTKPAAELIQVNPAAPKEPTNLGQIFNVGADVLPPKIIHAEPAEYTAAARSAHIEGTVVLQVVVDATGRPVSVTVLRSLDPGLDENAIKSTSQWRYAPATRAGKPVPVRASVVVRFSFKG